MQKSILTTLNIDDFTNLIVDAIKKANLNNQSIILKNDIKEDYLSQKEAAKFLRISLPTIIRWKKQNKIPYYQEGRTVLYKKSELLQTLRKNEALIK